MECDEKAEASRTSRAREAWSAAENHRQPGMARPAGASERPASVTRLAVHTVLMPRRCLQEEDGDAFLCG